MQTFYPRKSAKFTKSARKGYLLSDGGWLLNILNKTNSWKYGYNNNLSSSTVSNLNSSGKASFTCCVVITSFVMQIFHMLTFASDAWGNFWVRDEHHAWGNWVWAGRWWRSSVIVCFGVRFHDCGIKLQEFYGSLHTISCYAVIYRELLTHSSSAGLWDVVNLLEVKFI